ncbi:MAG TPA: hypothetical protein ENI85_13490 [Deltaproteobacteria bacterium]|nr:hypothetical protein [Deltaproteobacteria bacterium]
MLDQPDMATLLGAIARTLDDEVLASTAGPAQHAVRVIANLCRILEREIHLGPTAAETSRRALADLLGRDAPLPELVGELDARLRQGTDDGRSAHRDSEAHVANAPRADDADFDERVRLLLLADVERRLAIDRPGYAS